MNSEPVTFWRTKAGMALLCVLAVVGFFLVTEHTAHVLGALPFVLLAACPLMHLFMHHGGHHHGHGSVGQADDGTPPPRSEDAP
jgi:hypothetical protein